MDALPSPPSASPPSAGASAELVRLVGRSGIAVPPDVAIAAVLETLGEVLPFGTAGYLAANLPVPVRARVGRHFPVDGPVGPVRRRDVQGAVAVRCGRTVDEADDIIRAVTGALAHVVPLGVLADVRAEAPEPLLDLLPSGRPA